MRLLDSLRRMVHRSALSPTSAGRPSGRRTPGRRLGVEALEDRTVPSFTFQTIDVPGATLTEAAAVNDAGEVVGRYVAGGVTHGFLLSRGALTTIDVPGATATAATGLNDAGRVVGQYT